MSVRRDDDDVRSLANERAGDDQSVPVGHRQSGDPVTMFGLVYRAISNRKLLLRLCVLLAIVTALTLALGRLVPPEVLISVLNVVLSSRA